MLIAAVVGLARGIPTAIPFQVPRRFLTRDPLTESSPPRPLSILLRRHKDALRLVVKQPNWVSLSGLRTHLSLPSRRSASPRLGVQCVHSTPYHPQTCGKVERFHQTFKLFLAKQAPAESLAHLQLQLEAFRIIYNQHRRHRALDGRTPLQAFHARLKASPSLAQPPVDYRIRRDRLDADGRVTLRYLSRIRHFHISYKHRAGQ